MTAENIVAAVTAAYIVVPVLCIAAIFWWPNPTDPAPAAPSPGVQYWARGTARPVELDTRENEQVGYHAALAARPAEGRHRR